MEWVHCNKCYLRYNTQMKFYITTCTHVQCHNCANRTSSLRECVVCRTSCQLTPLNNEMRPELAEFFTPLSKNMENFYQAMNFQFKNNFASAKIVFEKCALYKEQLKKYYGALHQVRQENNKLRMTYKKLLEQRKAFSNQSNNQPGSTRSGMVNAMDGMCIGFSPNVTQNQARNSDTYWNKEKASGNNNIQYHSNHNFVKDQAGSDPLGVQKPLAGVVETPLNMTYTDLSDIGTDTTFPLASLNLRCVNNNGPN